MFADLVQIERFSGDSEAMRRDMSTTLLNL